MHSSTAPEQARDQQKKLDFQIIRNKNCARNSELEQMPQTLLKNEVGRTGGCGGGTGGRTGGQAGLTGGTWADETGGRVGRVGGILNQP